MPLKQSLALLIAALAIAPACSDEPTAVVKDLGKTTVDADHLVQTLYGLTQANPDDSLLAVEARIVHPEGKLLSHVRFLYDRDRRLLLVLKRTIHPDERVFYHFRLYDETDPADFKTREPVRAQKGYPKIAQSFKREEVTIPIRYDAFPKLSNWP